MTTSELIEDVLDLAVEDLRQTSFVPFWKDSIDVTPREEIEALFRDSRKSDSRIKSEIKDAAALRQFESFMLETEDNRRDDYGNSRGFSVIVKIKDDAEWDAVLRDAWSSAKSPNDWFLSDNALRLLQWIQSPKNTGEFAPINRIGAQAGLRGSGSYSNFDTYLKEISLKSPYQTTYESTGRWGGDYKISITQKTNVPQVVPFSNPVYSGSLASEDSDSVKAFGQILEDGILGADLDENGLFLMFNIRSRVSLVNAFPGMVVGDEITPYRFNEFLSKIKLSRGINVAASLDDEASTGWRIGAVVEDGWTWKRARESIREQRNRQNSEELYGLSKKSAKFLDWIMNLHDHEFELDMTPCIESVPEEQIGVEGIRYDRNSGAILGLLIEEINEKTNYVLRLIPWKEHYQDTHHRILARRKPDTDADLVKQIQVRGLDKGVQLSAEKVGRALELLWSSWRPAE